jgi:hypothetical protein
MLQRRRTERRGIDGEFVVELLVRHGIPRTEAREDQERFYLAKVNGARRVPTS